MFVGEWHSLTHAFMFFTQVPQSIEGNYMYVDGVSVTHKSPGSRQHIWTYATGIVENNPSSYPPYSCPCADHATALSLVPSFMGRLLLSPELYDYTHSWCFVVLSLTMHECDLLLFQLQVIGSTMFLLQKKTFTNIAFLWNNIHKIEYIASSFVITCM